MIGRLTFKQIPSNFSGVIGLYKFEHFKLVNKISRKVFELGKHETWSADMTSICFSVPGSETLPILLKFSRFSAQFLGFSADFHRKSFS